MNFKEKVKVLSTPRMHMDKVQKAIVTGVVDEDDKNNRITIKRDVRTELKRAMDECEVSQGEIARALGTQVQKINNWLNGHRPLPYEQVEEVLWLLDGTMEEEGVL